MKKFIDKKLTANQAREIQGEYNYWCYPNSPHPGTKQVPYHDWKVGPCTTFNSICNLQNPNADHYKFVGSELYDRKNFGLFYAYKLRCHYDSKYIIVF